MLYRPFCGVKQVRFMGHQFEGLCITEEFSGGFYVVISTNIEL